MSWNSDFSQAPFGVRKQKPLNMDGETHYSHLCHCRRRRLIIHEEYFYIYYRICFCGLNDKSQLFKDTPNDTCLKNIPKNREGKEIHEESACKYLYVNYWNNTREFQLHCECIRGKGIIRK